MSAVQTENLRRVYPVKDRRPEVVALNDVSLTIEEGEVFGLLGPNGAGKTTLVKVLSTVLLPTSGSVSVLGHDIVRSTASVRPKIGIVLGGDRGFYLRLTARKNLLYWAALYNVPAKVANQRVSDLRERFGLGERADYRVETFSRGMRQRLHLARGLVANAQVLFLDEPTTGMDPVAAREFRAMIKELRDEGRTVLLTTHDMAEAEEVCDRVALIDRGEILATETPRTLGTLITKYDRIDFEGGDSDLTARILARPGVESLTPLTDGGNRIEISDPAATGAALALLVEAGITSIQTSRPNLEEVYVHIIGDRGLKI